MKDFKFKKLTVDNWLEPEEVLSIFKGFSIDGSKAHAKSGDEWASRFVKPNLLETVPIEIRELYEVSRGALVYGYFFYPLFTLGEDQLYRVAEAAVRIKCKEMGVPKSKKTFSKQLDYLLENKIISKEKKVKWDRFREFRNIYSHLEFQHISHPGHVIHLLEDIVEEINFLFNKK